MDFTFTEEQDDLRGLAEGAFARTATTERVKEIEASDERIDRKLWSELADAGLLGIALPEEAGGAGLGLVELCLVLEQQGRTVAPVPILPTIVTALTIAEHGNDEQRAAWLAPVAAGEAILTVALGEPGAPDPMRPSVTATDGRLTGTKVGVPAGLVADRVLVPATTDDGPRLFLVDPAAPGVTREAVDATNRERQATLVLDGASGEVVGGERALAWMLERWLVGLCAIQVGVAESAVTAAASYTSSRLQFGKPLSTFQGVALKAADAYIDTEAMRVTMWQAAWRLAEGLDAADAVLVAAWWAAEGGQHAVHLVQHLHGGIGADVDYPVHRYFLWGKQIENQLGGASALLARLGTLVAGGRA